MSVMQIVHKANYKITPLFILLHVEMIYKMKAYYATAVSFYLYNY